MKNFDVSNDEIISFPFTNVSNFEWKIHFKFLNKVNSKMSAINIFVHPQAMLVLSNHYSRMEVDNQNVPLKYHVGFLLGNYDGPKIVVTTALEAIVNERDGKLRLNTNFSRQELELHNTVYPNDIPIGWYVLDKCSNKELLQISEALSAFDKFENLLLGEFFPDAENKPPLCLFEPKGDTFIPVDYSYETELAERIAMISLQSEGNAESQIQFTAKAFQSLDNDLSIIETYLEKVSKGELPFDPTLMRACANVSQWWDHSIKGVNPGEEEDDEEEDRAEEQASVALLTGSMLEVITSLLEKMKSAK
ncbi:hypothetical protein TRFO_23464 [Tritrichomonas foetus]|uniref:Uncharacterized protein n=1 Tax=Tritrichomonas foetus TaxID=1144522 RepID=A0A1J4KEG3_9EUKA|nr:hypothetical protein TRFO_23464 [Tritrichomonas foetus]|eukprot:OHT08108.1 hypothetical protein TRFO_23464 [Tritrichomonas foetus]